MKEKYDYKIKSIFKNDSNTLVRKFYNKELKENIYNKKNENYENKLSK